MAGLWNVAEHWVTYPSVFFFLLLFKMKHIFYLCFILYNLGCILFVDFQFFSWFFFTNIVIYLCHSHYHFNVLHVGYGKAIQIVMQAEWLACFWCISNQDQIPGLPGYIILKYFPFQIVLFIHWLYLPCFLLFYLRDRCDSS